MPTRPRCTVISTSVRPSPARRRWRRVPHHLIDVSPPDEPIALGVFQGLAYDAIDDVLEPRKDRFPGRWLGAFRQRGAGRLQDPRRRTGRLCARSWSGKPRTRAARSSTSVSSGSIRKRRSRSTPTMCGASSGRSRCMKRPARRSRASGTLATCVTARCASVCRAIERRSISGSIGESKKMLERGLVEEVRHILDLGFAAGQPCAVGDRLQGGDPSSPGKDQPGSGGGRNRSGRRESLHASN